MPALWIAHVTVTDEDAYGKYAKLAGPAIAAHGGSFWPVVAASCSLKARNARAMLWPVSPLSRMRSIATTPTPTKRR